MAEIDLAAKIDIVAAVVSLDVLKQKAKGTFEKLNTLTAKSARKNVETVAQTSKNLSRKIGDDLRDVFSKTSKEVKKLNDGLRNFGRNATAFLTIPLTLAGAAITKFGADFDLAMTEAVAVMRNVSSDMRTELELSAKATAEITKFSSTEVANSLGFLARAGFQARESMEALPVVAKFAQAGVIELATATSLLVDSLNGLGLAVKDDAVANMENMLRVGDVLVDTATRTNATVRQLAESLTNRAGSALKFVNKEIEEGAAILAVYAQQGLKSVRAGVTLDIVLRDLFTRWIKNKEQFKELKVEVADAAGNMNNIADIIGQLETAMKDMSPEQKRMTLQQLEFQDKSVIGIIRLLGLSDALREFQISAENSGGSLDKLANKQMKAFTNQAKLLGNALENVAITILDAVKKPLVDIVFPVLRALIKLIQLIATGFSKLPSLVKLLTIALIATAAAAGPVIIAFIALSEILPILAVGFTALTASISPLTAVATIAATVIFGLVSDFASLRNEALATDIELQRIAEKDVLRKRMVELTFAIKDSEDALEKFKKKAITTITSVNAGNVDDFIGTQGLLDAIEVLKKEKASIKKQIEDLKPKKKAGKVIKPTDLALRAKLSLQLFNLQKSQAIDLEKFLEERVQKRIAIFNKTTKDEKARELFAQIERKKALIELTKFKLKQQKIIEREEARKETEAKKRASVLIGIQKKTADVLISLAENENEKIFIIAQNKLEAFKRVNSDIEIIEAKRVQLTSEALLAQLESEKATIEGGKIPYIEFEDFLAKHFEKRLELFRTLGFSQEQLGNAIVSDELKRQGLIGKADAKTNKERTKAVLATTTAIFGGLGRATAQFEANSRKAFNISKAFKLAEAITGTSLAVINALSEVNPLVPTPLKIANAATIAAIGAAQVATIAGTSFGGGGSVAPVSGGGGGASTATDTQQTLTSTQQPTQSVTIVINGIEFSAEKQHLARLLQPFMDEVLADTN